MIRFDIVTYFPRGYIADPYWPEREKLINVTKESGYMRARSEAKRSAALKQYLESKGLTLADYQALEAAANRPFHTQNGHIIIPELHVYGMLVAACDRASSAIRACQPDQVRVAIKASDWVTSKRKPDGLWERFASPYSGTGQRLSNQRALRSNAYIAEFEAHGMMEIDDNFVKPESLRKTLAYAGTDVGIGSSRKMGWGRFELHKFERVG